MTFESILKDIRAKKFAPLYWLQGDEEYFIDTLVAELEKTVLTPDEKEFNQTVFYGRELSADALSETAKRFPMMAERQLIIVKEAQAFKKYEEIESYLENPTPTTILVFAYKHGKVDARKKFAKQIKKHGVVFSAERLREYQVPKWINEKLTKNNYKITDKASALLLEYLGIELSKIANEIGKLMVNVPEGTTITDQHIQDYVGINKDFNFFELQNALIQGDKVKAQKIADYFGKTQKQHPFQLTVIMLLKFYTTLLKYHFTKPKDRTQDRLPKMLGVSPYFLKDYVGAAKLYNGKVVFRNVGLIRKYDMMSKGKGTTVSDPGVLLKELIPQLMMT